MGGWAHKERGLVLRHRGGGEQSAGPRLEPEETQTPNTGKLSLPFFQTYVQAGGLNMQWAALFPTWLWGSKSTQAVAEFAPGALPGGVVPAGAGIWRDWGWQQVQEAACRLCLGTALVLVIRCFFLCLINGA